MKIYEIQVVESINKVLLEHSHAHVFAYSSCSLHTEMAELSSYNLVALKTEKNLLSSP
jgi:hypothetical protein